MIDSLSRPIRRLLALAILAAIPLLLWLLLVSPLLGMVQDRQAAIAAQLDRLDRLEEVIGRIPALQALNRTLNERLNSEGDVWEEKSDTVVSAKMESIVRGIVEQNGGTLSSSTPLPVATEQEFKVVRVRFRISGPLEMVEKTFAGIEETKPVLFLDAFRIEVPANASPPDRPPLLDLDIEVVGYLRQASS